MIACIKCNDQNGPWIYTHGIGFICEECFEKKKHIKQPTKKRRKKENEK